MALSTSFNDVYEKQDFIAKGKFASVFVCHHIESNKNYAAKEILKKRSANSRRGATKESISLEIEVLKSLDHPNIIKIYETYETAKDMILILEYVPEGELFEYISDKESISEDEASKFIYQILLGVNHIHSKGYLHLDLKPENILVENSATQKIKIIDFGLAKKMEGTKPVLALQGTTGFLAPEVINYEPLSYTTDMWSVGIISFLMLTGYNPFDAHNENDIHSNIVRCNVDYEDERFQSLSEMAKDFVKSLILRNPSERLLSDACIEHQWIKPEKTSSETKRRSWIDKDKTGNLKNYVVQTKDTRPVSMLSTEAISSLSSSFTMSVNNRLSLPVNPTRLQSSAECDEEIDDGDNKIIQEFEIETTELLITNQMSVFKSLTNDISELKIATNKIQNLTNGDNNNNINGNNVTF